jgi:hypothetical protein
MARSPRLPGFALFTCLFRRVSDYVGQDGSDVVDRIVGARLQEPRGAAGIVCGVEGQTARSGQATWCSCHHMA